MADSRNNIRVLIAIRRYYPDGGGAEAAAHRLALELIQKGIDVNVLTGRYGRKPRTEMMGGVKVNRLFIGRHVPVLHELFFLASFTRELVRRRHDYDVIHLFQTQLPALVAVFLGKRLGKAVMTSSRGGGKTGDMAMWSSFPGGKQMLQHVARGVDTATGVSRDVVAELRSAGFDGERTWYVPNGVSVPSAGGRAGSRKRLGFPKDGFITVFVGRLSREKGLDGLLRAWAGVIEKHHKSRLIIVGDGPERDLLEEKRKEGGLEASVLLAGQVGNVEDYLRAADVFVLPSFAEGMSNALLEAMSVGLPVIASKVSGTVDVVKDGENGLLFEPGNVNELADCILSLIESAEQRRRLGTNGRATIEKDFSIDAAVDRYISLYQSLVDGRGV